MKRLKAILASSLLLYAGILFCNEEITPYKFKESFAQEIAKSSYVIPSSARFTVARNEENTPDIVYYFSKPKSEKVYPIAILCTGSTTKDSIGSVIHFHRYFLQEFLDLGIGVITVEQRGIDGSNVNKVEFIAHYTRSARLQDHQTVLNNLKVHPPEGWNGQFIFFGVSECGPLVTTLSELYPESAVATINWCGAGDWAWDEELWAFIGDLRKNGPWWLKLWDLLPSWFPFSLNVPKSRNAYDSAMKEILANPCADKEFMGMTYLYHADALQEYPQHEYKKIKTPFLSVVGSKDPMIDSADCFAKKALDAGVDLTYMRVEGMDHYIRHRPDIIEKSFEWLKNKL